MIDLDGYDVLDVLVETDTVILLRARHRAGGRDVVVKLLRAEHPAPAEVARLTHEHEMTRDLPEDSVVRPEGVVRLGRRVGLVMADHGGRPLSALLAGSTPDTARFLRLAAGLADALGAVHEAGVVHGDVKPSNVLVDGERCRLLDFELATPIAAATAAEGLRGTPSYVSPEQTGRTDRAVDHRSDLYSLGVTYYLMLTGRLPFTATDALELVHCHLAVAPVPPADVDRAVPAVLSDIVLRLLAKAPEDRYQSAHGLADDLRRCLRGWESGGTIEPFPLATTDASVRFAVPDRLYGREAELAELSSAAGEVAGGGRLLVLLAGPAGVGKTALVDALGPALAAQHCYAVQGKFDQFSRDVPYASLVEALGRLVRQLLSEPADQLAAWRDRLRATLRDNVGVVAEVLPDLRLIVGETAPVTPLGPAETQNRFNLAFGDFVGLFARPEHPLVMFLDDLHWADVASLKLLMTMLTDPDRHHLLLIGAYRPAEVSESHPLAIALGGADPAGLRRLELGPLDPESVGRLVSDTLRTDAGPLGAYLHERSAGNPFFLRQLFGALAADGLLRLAAGRWVWDLDAIRAHRLPDDVVEFVVARLALLPEPTRGALRVGSVIGARFSLALAATLLGRPEAEVAEDLNGAVRAALVLPAPDAAYRFVHDRVQQACHSTISTADLPDIHLRVGRLMLHQINGDDGLFEVVGHLNQALALITEPDRRLRLAALNLRAAEKARASTALDGAAGFARAGLALLPDDVWATDRDLAFRLALLEGEALGALGRVAEAEAAFEVMFARGLTDMEAGLAHYTWSDVLFVAGRIAEAYEVMLNGLAGLGVALPADPAEAAAETGRLMGALLDPAVVEELDGTGPADERAVLIGQLYSAAVFGAYSARPDDLALVAAKAIQEARASGITPHTCVVLSWFGGIAMAIGQLELGIAYGRLAVRIADRADNPLVRARARMLACLTSLPWDESLEVIAERADETYLLGLSAGDLAYAGYHHWMGDLALLLTGRDSAGLLTALERWQDTSRRYTPFLVGHATIRIDQMRRLAGLPREEVDAEAIVTAYEEQRDGMNGCESLFELARIDALFGAWESSYAHACRAEAGRLAGGTSCAFWTYLYDIHMAVACARLAAAATDDAERAGYLAKLDSYRDLIRPFAELPAGHGAPHAALVEAERHRALGEPDAATAGYLRCIDLAAGRDYTLLEGWATELLGRLHHEAGRSFARGYLAEARSLYLRCGADGKAAQLDAEFGEPTAAAPRFDAAGTTTHHGPSALDLATVVKAAQAIASEVAYDRVIDRLVEISVQNAGAERGVFVAVDDPRGGSGDDIRFVEADAPSAVIAYVARTRQPVIIADITRDDAFGRDPYVLRRRPLSVAAGPITRNDRLLGVLYLENSLLAGAFTRERLEMLRLLLAQMAISLENARLYGRLEDEVAERTRDLTASLAELRTMQAQIVESEKLAALGSLVAGVAHEVNTPIGVAVTAASHLAGRTAEFAAAYAAGPLRRSDLSRFTGTVRDAEQIMATNLRRATDLVSSFKQVAVDQSSEHRRRFAVAAYLDDILASLRPTFKHTPHRVELDCDPTLSLDSYPGALAQIVTNLVINSLTHAYPEGTSGTLALRVEAAGEELRILYSDDGTGIPADVQPRIFEPFFTTNRAGGGSGLGLHIVHNLVTQRLGGSVTVSAAPAAGTRFTITVPRVAPAPAEVGA